MDVRRLFPGRKIAYPRFAPSDRLAGRDNGERIRTMAHKFEIYKDKAGEFRVRFKFNAETIFSTEGYASKASAQNAIDSIKKNGPSALVEDNA
jgi:uncharacterized protein YegP (UPF0339 family)